MLQKIIIIGIAMLVSSYFKPLKAQSNLGNIRGIVKNQGDTLLDSVDVKLFDINNPKVIYASVLTEKNGSFTFSNINPGSYQIICTKNQFNESRTDTFEVYAGKTIYFNKEKTIKLNHLFHKLNTIKVNGTIIKKPITDKLPKTRDEIFKTALGPISIIGQSSGVVQTPGGLSSRGSRVDGTQVFVDGIRVLNSNFSSGMLGYVDNYQSGISAQYGDFTGMAISILTKGGSITSHKSNRFDVVSSSLFNPFHLNSIDLYHSTPILFKVNPEYVKGNSDIKKIAIASMHLGGQFNYQKDVPSFIGYQVIKPEKLDEIEKQPLIVNQSGSYVHAANYLTENDFNTEKVRPNAASMSGSAQVKFDIKLNKYCLLTSFSNFNYAQSSSSGNNIMAYKNNPFRTSYDVLTYLRYDQKFKEPDANKKEKSTTLNNTFLSARIDYQSSWSKVQDREFKDQIFKYGYLGQFKHYNTEFYSYYGNLNNPSTPTKKMIDQNGDTVYLRNFWEQTGFRDTAVRFVQADINKVRGNYTKLIFDKAHDEGRTISSDVDILQNLGLLNGYNPVNIYSLWNSPGTMMAGQGTQTSNYSKRQVERYGLYAMLETELKGPVKKDKEDKGHALQFGLTYEQTVYRGYSLNANNLWRQMNLLANNHITELDKSNPILSYDANGIFQDTVRYNRLINYSNQSEFDKQFRQSLIKKGALDINGKPITESTYLDINSYKPEDFNISMFSADELLNNGSSLVNYYGYDYKGNKIRKRPSINDFINDKNKRSIGAFQPIYTAMWFQDKFNFKDLEFNLGVRVDRYDANQLVLKDPYSLYPIKTAGEVSSINGTEVYHPENIESEYAVYVDDVKNPSKILGYRKENDWYDANGNKLANPDLIANNTSNGKIAPYLVDPNNQNITENSFKDYKPKVHISPRVSFNFPLNKNSVFYASYDVLTQRPNADASFLTIDDYYYMTQKASNTLANPALNSRITNDYQIGYKQRFKDNIEIGLISYYRETKNDVAIFQYNHAYPMTYISYNNIDFSTVKGFIAEAQIKAKNNMTINGNYTLQFADGTGSNINSQRALIASNQPNLRSLFPMGNLDIRHQLKTIINWEFFDSKIKGNRKEYKGPMTGKIMWLKNTNFNFTLVASSGLPYTATSKAVQQGSADRAPIKGTPFGSRLPWQFNSSMSIQKNIPIRWVSNINGKGKGAYFQLYLSVDNLLNRRNVNFVWPYTGSAINDGYLNSPQGQQAINNQLNANSYQYFYNTSVDNVYNYQAPRFSRIGGRFYF